MQSPPYLWIWNKNTDFLELQLYHERGWTRNKNFILEAQKGSTSWLSPDRGPKCRRDWIFGVHSTKRPKGRKGWKWGLTDSKVQSTLSTQSPRTTILTLSVRPILLWCFVLFFTSKVSLVLPFSNCPWASRAALFIQVVGGTCIPWGGHVYPEPGFHKHSSFASSWDKFWNVIYLPELPAGPGGDLREFTHLFHLHPPFLVLLLLFPPQCLGSRSSISHLYVNTSLLVCF